MKFICLILSLYVLLLSAKPCCTDDICQSRSSIQKELSTKSPSPEKECADCSPFFSCGTCAGFLMAKPVVHPVLFVSEKPAQSYSAYRQPYVQEIALTIWQPPKLG